MRSSSGRAVSNNDRSDAELVSAFLEGDGSAFTTIVRRYHQRLFQVARRYTTNYDDALDIVQEALLRASRGLAGFRWESSLGTWLHRLVMNCGYDFVHHSGRRECTILDDVNSVVLLDAQLKHDPVVSYEEQLVIDGMLGLLSPEHRDAIVQVDVVGHSVSSLAADQGVRPGTIKSRRARAKQHLRSLLVEGVFV